MKFLLTGFDPFGGEAINPAFEAVKRLPDEIDGHTIIKQEIPTVFQESIRVLKEAIERVEPDWVIAVGQAGGRFAFTPEKVAINYDQARIPDNAGNQPMDQPIREGGPVGYFSSLPINQIVKSCQANSIPAAVSYTAGTFVCNHIFYGLMDTIAQSSPETRGGFIHVPFLPEQVISKKDMPFMSLEMLTKALELAIRACIENPDDLVGEVAGGEIA